MMEKVALLSLYRKEGSEELAQVLASYGYKLIATKGTASFLSTKGLKVTSIQELTGVEEDKRVKTLHYEIFKGILSIPPQIRVVVVDLYPFLEAKEKNLSLEELTEFVDIGGVSLIRAAAKNYKYVTVIKSPKEYEEFIKELKQNHGETSLSFREKKAASVFLFTSMYDLEIARNLFSLKNIWGVYGQKETQLKYGENPHQKAVYYRLLNKEFKIKEHLGHALSYNNLLDIHRGILFVQEFEEPACAIIKHTIPCGAATAKRIEDAFEMAYNADSISAYGGVAVINRPLNIKIAEFMRGKFFEVIASPLVDEGVFELMKKKKKLRVVTFEGEIPSFEMRSILGGFLVQDRDMKKEEVREWRVMSKKKPSPEEERALLFAWKVVKHLKSNAVCITTENVTLGIGTGQPNRVDAVRMAVEKAKKYKGLKVLASDGFFPFRDSIDVAAEEGITAVVEPGGSIRDEEVIKAADEHKIALLFTNTRHFLH